MSALSGLPLHEQSQGLLAHQLRVVVGGGCCSTQHGRQESPLSWRETINKSVDSHGPWLFSMDTGIELILRTTPKGKSGTPLLLLLCASFFGRMLTRHYMLQRHKSWWLDHNEHIIRVSQLKGCKPHTWNGWSEASTKTFRGRKVKDGDAICLMVPWREDTWKIEEDWRFGDFFPSKTRCLFFFQLLAARHSAAVSWASVECRPFFLSWYLVDCARLKTKDEGSESQHEIHRPGGWWRNSSPGSAEWT